MVKGEKSRAKKDDHKNILGLAFAVLLIVIITFSLSMTNYSADYNYGMMSMMVLFWPMGFVFMTLGIIVLLLIIIWLMKKIRE